jgi:hypothetical protein
METYPSMERSIKPGKHWLMHLTSHPETIETAFCPRSFILFQDRIKWKNRTTQRGEQCEPR